jgi:hypothetical protein
MNDNNKRELADAEAIQRAQGIAADVHRELPDDTELDVAFAEFKRRLGILK